MPDDITYLTKDFVPVSKDDPRMKMVKVRMPDGRIVFGVPEKPAQNKLFKQTFEDHKGRPGKVGGSLPKDSSSGGIVTGERDSRHSKVEEMVNRIPENELKGISEISVSKEVGPPISEGFGHLSGSYNTATKKIEVYSNSDIPAETVAHEIGHNVYNQMLDYGSKNFYERLQAREKWDKICKKRYSKSKFITWYDSFREDPNETFAELYKVYTARGGRDSGKLKEFLRSDGQDDTELEKPFLDILKLAG